MWKYRFHLALVVYLICAANVFFTQLPIVAKFAEDGFQILSVSLIVVILVNAAHYCFTRIHTGNI